MKRILIFLAISISLFSCSDKGTVVIKGKLENSKGEYIYLQELTVNGDGVKDSLLLPKSGSFKFKRVVTYPTFFTLHTSSDRKYVTLLGKPGDRIKIKGMADSLFYTYNITGSEESTYAKVLSRQLDKTIRCVDSLNRVYRQFQGNPNILNIRNVLEMSYNRCIEEQRNFTIAFIEKNPSSLASILAIYQKINSNKYVLDEEGDMKYMIMVDSALSKKYREAPFVKQLHANIELMKDQKKAVQLQRMLSIMGSKAPEIALPSAKGDTVRLSSVRNKVALVYFWASWNKESRNEQLKLVPIYNTYKAKGFEIFGVSIDKNKTDWLNAIRSDGAWWTQSDDTRYWMSPVVKSYNVDKLPTTFLLDKDGTIISRDLKGDALKDKLAEIFGEKTANTASK